MALAKPGRDKANGVFGALATEAFCKLDSILMMMASLLHELRYVQYKCQNPYTCPSLDASLVPDGFLAVAACDAIDFTRPSPVASRVHELASKTMVVKK
jgi:hypothetical protein